MAQVFQDRYGAVAPDREAFNQRKKHYLERRDAFRNDSKAMEDLINWKARNHEHAYSRKFQKGLVPQSIIGESFKKADTFFSEYSNHNSPSLILSESQDSYIIGNRASHDGRQYPPSFNPDWTNGKSPEGQGFCHTLVIPKRRIFNVVDPEATANDCAVLKEMKDHFIWFWDSGGKQKILQKAEVLFSEQSEKLLTSNNPDGFPEVKDKVHADFARLKPLFLQLGSNDFVYAFHVYPENSVGHLHMHVFPVDESLREHSAKRHDWKTVPIEAILEAEKEIP
ncbi:MAG: hypothetical protein LQ351_006800 [Letrouitia transgressa]|nr:MAG: hypothetical protein LQ351_006800 [Letrouitia transgressa]